MTYLDSEVDIGGGVCGALVDIAREVSVRCDAVLYTDRIWGDFDVLLCLMTVESYIARYSHMRPVTDKRWSNARPQDYRMRVRIARCNAMGKV